MIALRKRPGEPWEAAEVENTLEALQAEVGGRIASVRFATDAVIIRNEEDRPLRLSRNDFSDFVGTILLVGTSGDEFTDTVEAAFLLPLIAETIKNAPGVCQDPPEQRAHY